MARRGFPPRGEFTNKSAVLSTRIRADTRAALEKAAKASKRSLSQEIEFRLRRSFSEDKTLTERFGNRRTYRLFQLAADVANALWNPDKKEADWLDDPSLFDVVAIAINGVLQAVRPPGAKDELSWVGKEALEASGWCAGRHVRRDPNRRSHRTIRSEGAGVESRGRLQKSRSRRGRHASRIETRPTRPGHATIHLAGSPDGNSSKPKRKGRNSERTHPPPGKASRELKFDAGAIRRITRTKNSRAPNAMLNASSATYSPQSATDLCRRRQDCWGLAGQVACSPTPLARAEDSRAI